MRKYRIRTEIGGENHAITVNLDQSYDLLEVLSLKLTQTDVYRQFGAEYGVIAGRVLANRGVGVPNARVSVFIPLSDADADDPVLSSLYPYKTTTDRNSNGIRYNLLENVKQNDCHTAVGSFPSKREFLDNNVLLEIYDKYYKFTAVTNQSGDYMIVGVPLGVQILHMDCDISDIGYLSIKPYDLTAIGYNAGNFINATTFKTSTDLDTLTQVQTQNKSIEVRPFWSNLNRSEIIINRVDFELAINLTPTALFFGTIFSDQQKSTVNLGCRPRVDTGKNCEFQAGAGSIEAIRRVLPDQSLVDFLSFTDDEQIDENGNFALAIPMNLNPVITDEEGNLVPSEDPTIGIPTQAMVRFRIAQTDRLFDFRNRTAHYLVPNLYNRYYFDDRCLDGDFFTMEWNKIYAPTQFIARYQKNQNSENKNFIGIKKIGECEQVSPFPYNRIDTNFNPLYIILCIILGVIGGIVQAINNLFRAILFNVIMKFICFVQHPANSDRRAACRCLACKRLNNDSYPPGYTATENLCADVYQLDPSLIPPPDCAGLCEDCNLSIISLNCNGFEYENAVDWANCQKQVLAQALNSVTYEFYNDWVIGSLYAFNFKYRVRLRKRFKTVERFCDFNCREAVSLTPSNEHYNNKCRTAYIVDRDAFDAPTPLAQYPVLVNNGSPADGRGVIVEFENFLYYVSRYDIEINPPTSPPLTVGLKKQLLYATNITELGSKRVCDPMSITPFIIDKLQPTTYQLDEGIQTMYDASDCVSVNDINTVGVQLICQAGVEIVVTQQDAPSPPVTQFLGDDDETYSFTSGGSSVLLPDYGGANGVIIFDRDIEYRKYLCQSFNYFNTTGTYSSIARPAIATDFIEDGDGNILTWNTDTCNGFDNFGNVQRNMPPYYMYFGVKSGNTALDKLKKKFINGCKQ